MSRWAWAFASLLTFVGVMMGSTTSGTPPDSPAAPPSPAEARERARLLHETIHATLHVVHRDYYREDESLRIPAASLERVFAELEKRQQVQLHWIAVDTQAMNVDHKPRDEFEKQAAKALALGQQETEHIGDDSYRFAGAITLTSDCLKCHAPSRSSNQDRAAGLVITIPLKSR